MAKKIVADAVVRESNIEGVVVAENNSFGDLQVRNVDAGNSLDEGDVIEIPEDYTVLKAKITPDAENLTPFIIVSVTSKEGIDRAMRFYPNSLAKVVFPIDEDGKHLPKVKTTGTAALAYQKHANGSVDEAMKIIKGKKIKVTAKTQYMQAPNRFNANASTTYIYGYDFED